MSTTLRRGLSEEIGSWKIICVRRRNALRSLRDNCEVSTPSIWIRPEVGSGAA